MQNKDFIIIENEVYMLADREEPTKLEISKEPGVSCIASYPDKNMVFIKNEVDMRLHQHIISNDRNYHIAKKLLLDNKVKTIKTLQRKVRMFVEYEIREVEGAIISSGITIVEPEITDLIGLTPVSHSNELKYTKEVVFNGTIHTQILRKKLGIMCRHQQKDLVAKIKNVQIIADIKDEEGTFEDYLRKHHECVTFKNDSPILLDVKQTTVKVYDTETDGGYDVNNEWKLPSDTKQVVFQFIVYINNIFELFNINEFMDIIEENNRK